MAEALAVQLDGVGKTFELNGASVAALDNVSLAVQQGEFVALVGPSGCGKSTLLRIVAGLLKPSNGHVRVFEDAPEQAIKQRLVGFVFQAPVLLPWRSVVGNLQLPLEVAGDKNPQRIAELIQLVGLQGFEGARPSQLSGGMRQRVALARALITRPRLLLLDEPFGALDEITRQRMNLELLRIWREVGVTSLLVTHSVSEAVFLADRVVVLSPRPGKIARVIDVEFPRAERDLDLLRAPAFFARCATVSETLYSTAVAA